MSGDLHEKLVDELVDIMIIPDTFTADEVASVTLSIVINASVVAAGLTAPSV